MRPHSAWRCTRLRIRLQGLSRYWATEPLRGPGSQPREVPAPRPSDPREARRPSVLSRCLPGTRSRCPRYPRADRLVAHGFHWGASLRRAVRDDQPGNVARRGEEPNDRARRTATVTASQRRDGLTFWRATRPAASAIQVRLITASATNAAISAHEHPGASRERGRRPARVGLNRTHGRRGDQRACASGHTIAAWSYSSWRRIQSWNASPSSRPSGTRSRIG
jgi:hypothetical protein